MYVVSVAPIKRGIPVDELSYFTKELLPEGALVSVPLRGRSTHALVIRSVSVEDAKSEIKSAGYPLKRLEHVHATSFFRKEFIEAAEVTAAFFAASTGAVIQAVFPNALLNAKNSTHPLDETTPSRTRHAQKFILQAEEGERYATYKSHIREVFARSRSCFFVLPSVQDIEHAYTRLEKGIQNYTFILHSGLTKKEIEKRWAAIGATDHPVLVIATPLFLAIPRRDIESVILDHESSGAYMLHGRPHIDMRYFVEQFTARIGADLILGDLFLRVETLYRKDAGEFEALMRPKSRISSLATQRIIDMRSSGEQPATGKIAIASVELVDMIEESRRKGTHCFILGVRRGFAPITVCGDCGTVVACNNCSAPLVLHRKSGAQEGDESPNIFLCHRCGDEQTTDRICAHCGGWRLIPLGIGVTQAEESIRQRFPDASVFRIDRDVIKKHSDARKVISEFFQTPGSILIGTEMAIPYLTEPVGAIAVLSVNSLLTIPDFRMGERVFRLLLTLREKAREHFLIQTRDPNVPLFELATQGNIGEFMRSELEVRKRLGYPPYAVMIKFTFEGGKVEGTALMGEIEKIFGSYHPVTFPGFISRVKGKYIMHALIKIPITEPNPNEAKRVPPPWPNPEILALIRALPTEITVQVNPESVI